MPATILVSRPSFETATKYGHYWFGQLVVEPAQQAGLNVIDLEKDKAVRAEFFNAIDEHNPIYITGVGHGNETTFTGQNYSVLLKVDDQETIKRVPNRHFHLLSCRTGAQLGPWLVDNGAVAYHGYKVTYYFIISTFPNTYAKPFFDSDTTIDRVLFEGKTHKEAKQACIAKYNQYIEDPNTPEICKRYLKWDLDGYVFYGDENSTITTPPPPPRRGAPSESEPKTITVKPKPSPEPTILTLETDKDQYISGETIRISGQLTFQSDGAPLPNRTIHLYINTTEITATTDSQGKYQLEYTAPEVTEETQYTVKAVFKGDQ